MLSALAHDCWPLLAALAACGALSAGLVRLGEQRGRPCWARLRTLAGNEAGGVQSLAFVITFPLFLLLVLFVIQISQLMIGLVVVHYAAFAAARSASVWIPAWVEEPQAAAGGDLSGENELPVAVGPGQPLVVNAALVADVGSRKLEEIWTAAVLACAPLGRSADAPPSGGAALPGVSQAAASMLVVVRALDSRAASNRRLEQRLLNKLTYAAENTEVELRFEDRSNAPTGGVILTYNPAGHPRVEYAPFEVGWRDPVAATVRHRLALLPGPGRWLAAGLAGREGRIEQRNGVYRTTLEATCTMSIAGLQSLRPTLHAPRRP